MKRRQRMIECWVPCATLALFMLIGLISPVFSLDLAQCRDSLGMQSSEIPDKAITASSSFDDDTVGPKFARIRTETMGGAWCPKPMIDQYSYEYLQIDLGKLCVVTMVEMQGRFGNGQGQEYTEQFLLEYQREDGGEWMRFRNKLGEELFNGNENTYLTELREVSPPIIGRRIRFIPYSKTMRTVCMRVEIYGCLWKDGVVQYNVRQGDRRGTELDFVDFTYDGMRQESFLLDGLGQLTDGEIGDYNFRLDTQEIGIKGYEWVGWRNDSQEFQGPLIITFKFDQVRNFSKVLINCNNLYSKDVRVFRMALIYFSVGGNLYQNQPIKFDFIRDNIVEYSRPVMIRLNHNIGKYVRLQLYFDAKWMMISEIQFVSEPATGNYTEEVPPPTLRPPHMFPKPDKGGHDHEVDVTGYHNKPGKDYVDGDSDSEPEKTPDQKSPGTDIFGIIIGSSAALITILIAIVIFIIFRHRIKKKNNNRRMKAAMSDNHNTISINLSDLRNSANGKMLNGNLYNGVPATDMDSDRECCSDRSKTNGMYREPKDSVIVNRGSLAPNLTDMPEFPLPDGQDYAVPDVTKSALMVTFPHSRPNNTQTNNLDKPPPQYDALYAASDIINSQVPNIPSLQGVSGNNVYAVPNAELLLSIDVTVNEFPRENLRFIEVLGEGQFGEVHLCEAINITNIIEDEIFLNRTMTRPCLVAVKILRKNAEDRARKDFLKEIKIMSQLKDPNIVRVLGVCTGEEPLCMIVEYMKYGDLNQFLLDHVLETPSAQAVNARILSYGCLIYMASQIATGMKYLESLNMVHRDLATRNCLVGTNFTIKISDFGMSRSLYSADYYRIEGRAVLPIRWMAWESILLGKFTTKSDVWSFGVTLWEILTFARDQPYDNLNDDQVIANAGHFYRNDGQQLLLPQPIVCPREIYDMIVECWNRSDCERPTFKDIHMFLLRKNMGYNPKDEKMNQIKVPVC
ncbi:discoidin domain-containing receptor 2-like isoform X2 [Mercenaria mercenaria]|uniref:discoidin domain-containing receptor 2-like isoform X2 n=1 Tax=Mercenaria mercenaria TaxID=6596 RepID=UPI00234EE377|nr:discoidin domain-containing receptor 2-like isoform X2 [Mercenaria mercenaria]